MLRLYALGHASKLESIGDDYRLQPSSLIRGRVQQQH